MYCQTLTNFTNQIHDVNRKDLRIFYLFNKKVPKNQPTWEKLFKSASKKFMPSATHRKKFDSIGVLICAVYTSGLDLSAIKWSKLYSLDRQKQTKMERENLNFD